jgi:hypothetical protein
LSAFQLGTFITSTLEYCLSEAGTFDFNFWFSHETYLVKIVKQKAQPSLEHLSLRSVSSALVMEAENWVLCQTIILRSVSSTFVRKRKLGFFGALAFDQFHQPSSWKTKIGIFVRVLAFDQFHQPSSRKPKIGFFVGASAFDQFHQPWSEEENWIFFLTASVFYQISLAFVSETKSWFVSYNFNLRQRNQKLCFFLVGASTLD